MTRKRPLPDFATLEEAADFWDQHDPDEFDTKPADEIMLAIKPEAKTESVNMRFEPTTLARTKRVAAQKDIPYQTLIRGLVKLGLDIVEGKPTPAITGLLGSAKAVTKEEQAAASR